MKYIFLMLTISMIFLSCEKETLELLPENILQIESVNTDENYEIHVLVPNGYDESKEYEVIYLLDGYYHFDYMRAEFAEKDYLQDVLLVGIFYKDYPLSISVNSESASVSELIEASSNIGQLRLKDLTYPENQQGFGGRGKLFYDFIADELLPVIEARYSVNDRRTIMGHSLGGYFGVFQMFEYPENSIFQNVISLDNQIWWADLYQLEEELRIHENDIPLPFKLYLGNAKHANFDTNVLLDEFVERLDLHQHEGLDYVFDRYDDGHAFSVKTGFQKGLKFVFDE